MGKRVRVGMIATILVLVGFGVAAAADRFEDEFNWEKIAIGLQQQTAAGGYQLVGTADLKAWIDAKKDLLIVDTMPYEDSYKKQHVPGAVQMEFPIPEMTSLDDKTKAALEKLLGPDKNRLIVFYCGFTKCTRSHNAAMWAVKLGYKNIYRYPAGIKGWDEAGYPVEKGK